MPEMLGPYLLGPNDTPENGIYTGDARLLSEAIPDESVDLIFTDPVYQNIDDYRWLAETANRILVNNGTLLACCGIRTLSETIDALRTRLTYRWLLGGFYIGLPRNYRWFPCVWACKGQGKGLGRVWDMEPCPMGHRLPDADLANHPWRKPLDWIARRLEWWCPSYGIVLDPFGGGGVTAVAAKVLGRRYLAFEIDPDMAETTRERVRHTQMPLFTLEPQQQEMNV